jgi:uncharacterized protein
MSRKFDLLDLPDRPARELFEFARDLRIIDAHEHFKPQAWHMEQKIDFSFLLGYCVKYMYIAGMKPEPTAFELSDLTPARKWRRMKPYWDLVKHTSYGKGVRLSAQAIIGQADITDRNYEKLSEVLAADNRPGMYERFCRKNHVDRAIVSNGTRDVEPHPYSDDDLTRLSLILGVISPLDKAGLEYYGLKADIKVRNAATLTAALEAYLDRNAADPAVIGWKSTAHVCDAPYDAKAADAAIKVLARGGKLDSRQQATLNRFFYEEAYRRLAKYGKPVAVHCGVAGDYRTMDVKNFIPIFQKFPDIRFDLFHMSLPNYQDFAWCGRNFANVSLNFCWAHLVSQELFERGVEACLDVVPLSKIIAFGGDFIFCPPAAVGGLVMAKESLARVLGRRVRAGRMGMPEARQILRMWFHDNPCGIYGIK